MKPFDVVRVMGKAKQNKNNLIEIEILKNVQHTVFVLPTEVLIWGCLSS